MGEKSGFSELGAEFIERLAKEIDYLHRRIDCLETSLMMLENHCNEQEHLLTETTVIMLNFLNGGRKLVHRPKLYSSGISSAGFNNKYSVLSFIFCLICHRDFFIDNI